MRAQGALRWEFRDASGSRMSFSQVVNAWREGKAMLDFWRERLRAVGLAAYTWECPPVTSDSWTRSFECVFVPSPALGSMRPEPEAFAEHFRPGAAVATFPNLGGDAILVAPCPDPGGGDFTHLASFTATARAAIQDDFWQAVGEAMAQRVGARPVWLSTAGLGVGWLHVRLDDRPKYYRHGPYRNQFLR